MSSTTLGTFDHAELERIAHLLPEPEGVVELRILDAGRSGTVSGYFKDTTAFVKACAAWSGKAPGVYLTLNPCNPALLARSQNHMKERAKATTIDTDIVKRRWLPIDFDPVRPTGISSTEDEHHAALARAQACQSWLTTLGWPEPVYADSGNGAHLLYRINLPNDDASRVLLQRGLQALALHFSDDEVALDEKVFNAARIWKVYGTLCCKGDHTPERPHGLARILEAPSQPTTVPQELLEALAAMVPEQPQAPRDTHLGGRIAFSLAAWIADHGLPVVREGTWGNGGHKWLLNPCPWNADHTDKAAYIVQFANGAIAAGCHHNGCTGKEWADLRDLYEPDWRRRREAWEARQTQAVNGTARVVRAAGSDSETREMLTTDEFPSPWVRSVDKGDPFPTEVFPGPCRDLIESTATALPCPPDFVGVPMLAVLGTAIGGNTRIVEVKPGWREGARLWVAVVAPPGSKKSPALARAVAPLHEILRLLMRDYEEKKRDYEEEMLTYEKELSAWRKDKSPGRAMPKKPEEPVARQPVATDSTVEALGDILSRNPRGILFERDELTGWARAMNQYKGRKGADRQTWLSFGNGAIAAIGRRARKDPLVIENPLVNIAGCLPPDVLEELNDEHGREDGFVHRILFAMPERVPPHIDGCRYVR
jgi:hypothetical protein